AALNVRTRNSSKGIIGVAACDSNQAKAASNATPLSSRLHTIAGGTLPVAPIKLAVRLANASVASVAPGTSSVAAPRGARLSGTRPAATASAARAGGTPSSSTARQETVSTSHPPNSGAAPPVSDEAADQTPSARPRSARGNEALR